MQPKKNYRDSLFRSIFNNKKRLQSLYKALSGKVIPLEEIKINTLRGVFFNDIKNDLSFQAGNRTVILMEHQSTWNPNMPLRMLWYVGKLYRKELKQDMPYRSTLIKIPMPEFYVLYNGEEDKPYETMFHLSDAFLWKPEHKEELPLDLTVKSYNINYATNNPLMDSCYELKAYSIFVAKVREAKAAGMGQRQAIMYGIDYCKTHDLLSEYFTKHEEEVFDMVSFKWDEKRAREVLQEETAEKTKLEMVLEMLKAKAPMELIVKVSKLSKQEIQELAQKHHLAIN